jgi:hypothetical protein
VRFPRLRVSAAEVRVRADRVTRRGAVAPLHEQAGRPPLRRRQGGVPGHGRRAAHLPGERRPEGELPFERLRRHVQAERIDAAGPAGAAGGRERRRYGPLAVPFHQAEREPAGALRDNEAVLPVLDHRAGRDRPVGLGVHGPGPGVDVQVEVAPARAAPDPLHPQVSVPGGRQQGRELAVRPPGGRQPVPGHLPPERHPGVERPGGKIEEDGQPAKRHAAKHRTAAGTAGGPIAHGNGPTAGTSLAIATRPGELGLTAPEKEAQ